MKKQAGHYDFLKRGGTMGKLIALADWSEHSMGPIESWPQSLKSALSICLCSKFPMAIYWGTDLRLFYNDAWSPMAGEKHPEALGHPLSGVLGDIWELVCPDIKRIMKSGEGSFYKNKLLPIKRNGFLEEAYFDYTISPIYAENQRILGVFNTGQEVTSRTLHDRRMRTLRDLANKPIPVESPEAACILITNTLSEAPADIPFGLIYLLNSKNNSLRLVASTTLENDTSLAKSAVDLNIKDSVLPFNKTIATKKIQIAKDLDKHFELPGGVWEEYAREAAFIPIIRPQTKELYGLLIGGISPRLKYDASYAGYFTQIAEITAVSIGGGYDLRRKINLEASEHEAQERLQTALSTGSIGIWMWDIPGNKIITDYNLAQTFGLDPSEAKAGVPLSAFNDRIHPEDRLWVLKEIQMAVDKTKHLEIEYRIICSDGATRWVIARGKVEDDDQGNPMRLPGVIVDITDRKVIEQELASSERMFGALFDSSIIGVAIMTLDGKVHEANERFLRMFGYKQKDLNIGFYTHMITPSKSKGVTSVFYQMLRNKGEVDPMETEYIAKNGQTVPVLAGAVIIPGSTDRFIAFMLDISEQKQLKAVNKTKDEFISIASHQLRTPATAVKQYLGMLREGYAGKLSNEQLKMVETAYSSNERQLIIVNDLLHVAQADANEIKLRLEPTDIGNMVKQVIKEQSAKFESCNQKIIFKSAATNPAILVDRLHMRMVFENLIDNAHKYTLRDKNISVTVSSSKTLLKVSIKDEGIGIYKKDMPKLFKKFSRIENPLSMSAGGTGLGLYWVHKVIELHQGTIRVASKYRHGSEFIITLPVNLSGKLLHSGK